MSEMWFEFFRLPLHNKSYQRFYQNLIMLPSNDWNILSGCCSYTPTARWFEFVLLRFIFICISKNWCVWVGTCSCALILGRDKQKQPPGIFIFVAVWGKRQPWFWTKVTAGNCQNKGTLSLLIGCWTTMSSFSVLWRRFYRFHKCINTNVLFRESICQCFSRNCGACCFHCHTKMPNWLERWWQRQP